MIIDWKQNQTCNQPKAKFISKDENTFGGDNYNFLVGKDKYTVAVGWGLLQPFQVNIVKNGIIITHIVGAYISAEGALNSIGIEVENK